ncbi:hypothetical protein FQN49_002742 [Arthroderma sp. PD_2]|nr:hypothetical protein FQN49_002742 [Arthroderma sp. PD_2]
MAQLTDSSPGLLSNEGEASINPSVARSTPDSASSNMLSSSEEADENSENEPIAFNSAGDTAVDRYDMIALGSARQDENGNPIFYMPDVELYCCDEDLPRGLHPTNVRKYLYQMRQFTLLTHLWVIQLGDDKHRTLWNIQKANAFWNSKGPKTWDGRTYAYYPNWLPDAIWRLRAGIKWLANPGLEKFAPRPGPVNKGHFPLLSEGWQKCKARHMAICKENRKTKNGDIKKPAAPQRIQNLCHRIMHEFTDDSTPEPNIAGGSPATHPGPVTRPKQSTGLATRPEQLLGSTGDLIPSLKPLIQTSQGLSQTLGGTPDLPVASRTRSKNRVHLQAPLFFEQ